MKWDDGKVDEKCLNWLFGDKEKRMERKMRGKTIIMRSTIFNPSS